MARERWRLIEAWPYEVSDRADEGISRSTVTAINNGRLWRHLAT